MKKADFIQLVAEKAEATKKDTAKIIDATLEAIKEVLKKDDTISFIGFGTFSTTERAAHEGKVPGTDKTYKTPASKVVKFKVGKELKESIATAKKPAKAKVKK